jgi:sugar phosphate isomerase/epimerase
MIYSGSGPSYESFYQGGYSSMSPEFGNFVGYRIDAGKLGQSMNPTTANQLAETIKSLKTGVGQVEVQMLGVSNDVDQQIPMEHFKEMRQLLKISGASASLHGPVIDPSGFGQRGADEMERQSAERRFLDAIEKAHELNVDKKKAMPVVFHGSNGMPGPIYRVDETKKPGEEGRLILERDFAINRHTGEPVPLKLEKKYYPDDPDSLKDNKGHLMTTQSQLNSVNLTDWENKLTELAQVNKQVDEIFGNSKLYLGEFSNAYVNLKNNKIFDAKTGDELSMTPAQEGFYNNLRKADIFIDNVGLNFRHAFDKAFEYGSEKQREELKKLAEEYSKSLEEMTPTKERPYMPVLEPIKKQKILAMAVEGLNKITSHRDPNTGKVDPDFGPPKLFQSAQEYATDKASETFSNVALESYKKFGESTPIISIENYAPGTAFNRAEDLKKLIDETRKRFAEKLNKEEKIPLSTAEKIAKKQIGATWDVGHVNFYKRYGFSDEELAEETAKIAPDVKHVHLTDNFGFSDSHLIPGMGNVPFKKHLEQLEKAGVLDKVRKVVEAGGYIQQIAQRGVHGETAKAFGSPIYGVQMANYWNQAMDVRGSYFGGYGVLNPSIHHNLYGAGFTTLPMEVGGNVPGGGSRFSGNSMS